MDHDLLAIGQFARLCRLSVKQLRHYDELGLLPPAQVDPNTGYRYYRADQARAAVSIALLRSLEVPLAAIGQVLAGVAAAEVLAGGVVACATHVGPTSSSRSPPRSAGLVRRRGHLVIDRLREIGVSDPRETPPEQLVTRS
jgi:DNA-binding transcriptional MerR regulator